MGRLPETRICLPQARLRAGSAWGAPRWCVRRPARGTRGDSSALQGKGPRVRRAQLGDLRPLDRGRVEALHRRVLPPRLSGFKPAHPNGRTAGGAPYAFPSLLFGMKHPAVSELVVQCTITGRKAIAEGSSYFRTIRESTEDNRFSCRPDAAEVRDIVLPQLGSRWVEANQTPKMSTSVLFSLALTILRASSQEGAAFIESPHGSHGISIRRQRWRDMASHSILAVAGKQQGIVSCIR